MIKTYKIQLCPNNKQQTKLFQTAGAARFAYNWAIAYEKQLHENGEKFMSDVDLRKIFTQHKKVHGFEWLLLYSNDATKHAIKDACTAYKNFFSGRTKFPKFKSKRKSCPSFYIDTAKIQFTSTHVKLEKLSDSTRRNRAKLNWVRLAEVGRTPTNVKYYNPRVTYDGLHWWISVGVEVPDLTETPTGDGIGIDLGVKDLAICSDGYTYKNINKSKRVKKLAKKKRRLQRKVSKKYRMNMKGVRYYKIRNIIKAERQLLKVSRALTNIRHNYIHQTTSDIVGRKPKFIVLEDLNVMGMMKNRHLAKAVQEQNFYEFYRQVEYKASWHNIEIIVADRFYPSSKLCSCCGNIKKDLTLRDRTYKCSVCGNIIDRDYQAAINLRNFAISSIIA